MEGTRNEISSPVLGTETNPVVFKWFRDEDDRPDWGKILLMLGLTIASGYLAAKSQRWGSSSSNPVREIKMLAAQKQITIGSRLQRLGQSIEESGWRHYADSTT